MRVGHRMSYVRFWTFSVNLWLQLQDNICIVKVFPASVVNSVKSPIKILDRSGYYYISPPHREKASLTLKAIISPVNIPLLPLQVPGLGHSNLN